MIAELEQIGSGERARRKLRNAVIDAKVDRAAGFLGPQSYLDRLPRALSGGQRQRQRVAMGRAIVRDPQVFPLDESLSNLDAKLRVRMRTEIRELHQRFDTTTVHVTHDQIEAMTMADRIVVMRHGHIAQVGSPMELYDRPADAFMAGFIGSPAMNLLPARGTEHGLAVAGGVVSPPVAVAPGREVLLGIRPEALRIDEAGLPARVSVVEPTGPETHVVLRMDGQEITAVFRERVDLRPGDELRLTTDPAGLHVFDAQSGARL